MRHINRALRYTFSKSRRKLSWALLHKLIDAHYPDNANRSQLLSLLPPVNCLCNMLIHVQAPVPVSMDVEPATPAQTATPTPTTTAPPAKPTVITPELEVYLWLLCVVFLVDNKNVATALKAVDLLMEKLDETNRRTMDPLSAKVYFYYSRIYELSGRLADVRV